MGTYWDEFIAKKGTEIEGMELVDILEMFFNWTGVASAVTRAKIERDKFKARVKELEGQYNELIMQVATKDPNQTRHETAMEMIRRGEAGCRCPTCSNQALSNTERGK